MTSRFNLAVFEKAVVVLALFVLLASFAFGQQLTGTLSGTTYDSTGAVVPDAKVTMKNEASGDVRSTTSNSSGYFTITAVQPGTYKVSVAAAGFKTWEENGIAFALGDSRTMPNIKLEVGQVSETVEIKAGADSVVPLDSGEVSTSLNTQMIQDLTLAGRDAGELLKLMPGMALNNGINQGSNFNTKVVGTNNGPVGSYSANGTQPNGAMSFMLDGANLVDPGNAGTQIANINQDMVSDVKVLMSSYSAEYAKGPVIFQAFSKSGGNHFHGEGYLYARNSALNSVDSFSAGQGLKNPAEHYYYAGGNIGGPIAIPGLGFNKGHNKLFFWAGYEYMKQQPAAAPINFNVPTEEQKGGDFSETTINGVAGRALGTNNQWADTPLLTALKNGPYSYAYLTPFGLPSTATAAPNNSCNSCILPTSSFDPNVTNILSFYPKSNIAPSAANGYNNFQYISQVPQNRWEATGKVDYAISDNTKLTGSYTRQIENDSHPIGVWWTPPWTLPYPSGVVAKTTSQEVMLNLTHVFSPTTTNEFVFTLARYINPSTLTNPAAVDRTKLGFNVTGLFGVTTKQIPNIQGPWGGAFPNIDEFTMENAFSGANEFGAIKKDPALYDNYTKIIGSHQMKFGFYWDTSDNVQSTAGLQTGAQGSYNLGWGSNGDAGNVVADFLLGKVANYQQQSSIPTFDIKGHQWSLYAQDSYKANKQLTLNYGLRFDHMGQWYGPANGMQVFNPATLISTQCNPSDTAHPAASALCANNGLAWHAIDKSVPLSGLVSPLFYYEPRVGLAYDVFGNGKTVLRSGLAWFRYQLAVNDVGGPTGGPQGQFTYTTNALTGFGFTGSNPTGGYAGIDCNCTGFTPPSAVAQNGSSISAFQRGDNKTPYVMDYNVTLSQSLPWRSVFEVSYIGNQSRNELINGNNGKIFNQNIVQPGAMFGKDPFQKNLLISPSSPTCTSNNFLTNYTGCNASYTTGFNANDYRPDPNYQDIYLITHGSYANYNSFQASWHKQSGSVTYLLNYTFSKVLGIRDGQSDNGNGNGSSVDPFNFKNNYGVLAYDHTHIVNLSAVWSLPKPIHSNHILEGAVNGWQFSTYTTYQSGAPLQPNLGGNFNAIFPSGLTTPLVGAPDLPNNAILMQNGLYANALTAQTSLGTTYNNAGLLPVVTCDPRKHSSGLYFNPNCFAPPALGQQGTLNMPYLHGPAYFDSDLALYKNFNISERQKLQFRVSATNWLNHALPQFGLSGIGDEQLNFTSHSTMVENSPQECFILNNSSAPCNVAITGLSQTNTNTQTTGKPGFKTGSRSLLFALKYYF